MEYLHLFSSETEHYDAYNGLDTYTEPWVGYDTESLYVTYNHEEAVTPIHFDMSFKDNCNSEEWSYFCSIKSHSDDTTISDEENFIFGGKLVSHTISGNIIEFVFRNATSSDGCSAMMMSIDKWVAGSEKFVDNGDGTYSVLQRWRFSNIMT